MTHRRHGSMLLEVTLSAMLLSVALVAIAQMLAVSARQRHESRWRAVATREVANITERVLALPWPEATRERFDMIELHPDVRASLENAELKIEATHISEPRAGKRIEVSLTYRNLAGLSVEPIRLVTWKFMPGGDP